MGDVHGLDDFRLPDTGTALATYQRVIFETNFELIAVEGGPVVLEIDGETGLAFIETMVAEEAHRVVDTERARQCRHERTLLTTQWNQPKVGKVTG